MLIASLALHKQFYCYSKSTSTGFHPFMQPSQRSAVTQSFSLTSLCQKKCLTDLTKLEKHGRETEPLNQLPHELINTDRGYNGKAFYFCQVNTPPSIKEVMGKGEKTTTPPKHYCHREHWKGRVRELQQRPARFPHRRREAELVLNSPQPGSQTN